MRLLSRFLVFFGVIATLALVTLAAAQKSQQGAVTVTRTGAPEKRLDFEVTVPAPVGEVWKALTTTDGMETWLWQDCRVDLRAGGDWIVNYPGGSTGGGAITSFEPMKSITMAAMAPEQFPTVRKARTTAVFRLQTSADGKATLVHLTQTGWKTGDEWDKAYDYLADGNAELLNNLRQRFVSGPFDWAAIMKQMQNSAAKSN
jgi:uncharacterized protein YndB with AHSA1/START domain